MKKTLRVFEAFAGIGAQHKVIQKLNDSNNLKFKVVGTSDWDARSNIVYSILHHGMTLENVKSFFKSRPDLKKNLNELVLKKGFSLNSKTLAKNMKIKDELFKESLVYSNVLSNNHPNIKDINGDLINKLKVDLLTYSFPCQGLSVANMGRDKGILNEESTSHLVWEIERILKGCKNKPKILILENVRQLVLKYKDQYEQWKNSLKKLGYKTFTAILTASEHGSLQKRQRVYAISIPKNWKTPFKQNDLDYEKYLIQKGSERVILNREEQLKEYLRIYDLDNRYFKESKWSSIKMTKSRLKYKDGKQITRDPESYLINTLTTRQDRYPNNGIIKFKKGNPHMSDYRLITPREAYKIMGFEDSDYEKLIPFIKKGILTKESLYRQAGNSIDVKPLQSVFETAYDIFELNGGNK